ncbi:DMT family transporter [Fictibacillus aquaticus]|uniref:EamA family transporter n=1 Tax=Fictibacillus aquaticus TaxID=2021314 RepID=A0A235F688_9BACL|nr:DMT family transporter [Fictibacillus aquaticus]OYD56708.1 EamA family transporter [Fictibacillus aquaticus]
MWIAAALATTLSFGMNNTIFKWSTSKGYSKVHIQFFFYIVAFLLTLSYGMAIGALKLDLLAIVLGSTIGILNASGNIQMSKAFEKGPASLTSPLIGANAILPILGSAIIFHEQISLIQWMGIMVILGSAILIQYSPGSARAFEYRPWMLRIILAILSFGILGILMKTTSHLQISALNTLICMYGGGSIFLGITSLREKENWLKSEASIGTIVGLVSVIGYSCYFYALQKGIASIIFPIVSLNCLVVILAGCWLFKEKLKRYQLVGIITALLGIIFIKI